MVLLLSLSACVTTPAATPLQNLNGAWMLSFDETIAENSEMRVVLESSPEMEEYWRRSMEGMLLLVDINKNTLTLRSQGEADNVLSFTLVSETQEDNTVVLNINDEEFLLIVSPQRLIWPEGDDSMVFLRAPAAP
jgi:hypothetical protein